MLGFALLPTLQFDGSTYFRIPWRCGGGGSIAWRKTNTQRHDFVYGYPVLNMKTKMDVNFQDARRTACIEKCDVSIAG